MRWEYALTLPPGRCYGRRGQTPVVRGTGKRFRCNIISTLTNRGKLYFKLFTQRFTAVVMIEFLRRLVRQCERKIFLIVNGHPVHRSKQLRQWLEQYADPIRLFSLPSYSPELNPDELLNHDCQSQCCRAATPQKSSRND